MSAFQSFPKCHDPRRCFAKTSKDTCTRLNSTYPAGKRCPFWKAPDNVDAKSVLSPKDRDEEIYHLNTDKHITVPELAETYGLSEVHVRAILTSQRRAHGIPARALNIAVTEEKQARAHELLTQGYKSIEIAEAVGVSPRTIDRWKQRGQI